MMSAATYPSLSAENAHVSMTGTRYFRSGRGSPVVLIHGVGLDATIWQAQFEALSQHHDVIAYDMLGHGGSKAPASDAGLGDYVTQLRVLLSELGLSSSAIVGFSMGGLVARLMAITAPEYVDSLVILSSVFDRSQEQTARILERVAEVENKGPVANVDAALNRWFSPAYQRSHAQAVKRIKRLVLANDPNSYFISYSLFAHNDNAGRERLCDINVPVMVATGSEDTGSTPTMARELARQLPHATCRVLPGMKHMLVMENAQEVNTLLCEFLALPGEQVAG